MSSLSAVSCGVLLASCGLVEVNHRMQADGSEAFTQAIAWRWCSIDQKWHAHDWVMITDWRRNKTSVVVVTDSGERIEIRCKFYRETWTVWDPEIEDRSEFPEKYRERVW